MAGPFPGMDPYLEDPILWRGVHRRLATNIGTMLNSVLPARYVADVNERLYVTQPGRDIYPDVSVDEQFLVREPVATYDTKSRSSPCDPPYVLAVRPDEIREAYVEVLSLKPERRVVTVIEILSPSNKTTGSDGRKLYLQKQQEVLASEVHLMEIDLLHGGEHTIAVPYERLRGSLQWDYIVSLHRGDEGWRFGNYEVWAILLRQTLPRASVPPADGDPDVVLDLQDALDRCYDEGAYHRQVNYHSDPPVTLSPEDLEWAISLLKGKGLHE
ncbi:MAG: DUF4058 family protein [Armatimonadetes bacterium]|nr:DUF4058 family protein [Armatimonadota bacterium]